MRHAVIVHQHPEHCHESHPEDHPPDQTPLGVTDPPPDSSARPGQDQDQEKRHALMVAAVAQPCKPRLGPRARAARVIRRCPARKLDLVV